VRRFDESDFDIDAIGNHSTRPTSKKPPGADDFHNMASLLPAISPVDRSSLQGPTRKAFKRRTPLIRKDWPYKT
jgi:hypothetical protein